MNCAVCGEHVRGGRGLEAFAAWESGDGDLVGREVVAVVHAECYMRLSLDERDALRDDAALAELARESALLQRRKS